MVGSTNSQPVSTSPPKFNTEFTNYIPPASSIPISAIPSANKGAISSSGYSPSIGFSYQPGMSTSTTMPPNVMGKPIVTGSISTVPPSVALSSAPGDSSANSNKFSLSKID